MTDATFEKVSRSDKRFYGPPKLLLCGFPADAQPNFVKVLQFAGMEKVPRIWVTQDQEHSRISVLLDLPHGEGAGVTSPLPRAIVVSGITQKELIGLMEVCRRTGMKDALWATLTPTSETWTVRRLLAELAAEREAFAQRSR
ncbi:MAG: DUF3783 domain-containing protein [Desulfatiglandales bacterium]